MKLSSIQIKEIKNLISSNTQMSLAVKYGVSIGTIRYHTDEVNRKKQIESSKKYFKNLNPKERKRIYLKHKDYLNNYQKNKRKEKKEKV